MSGYMTHDVTQKKWFSGRINVLLEYML